MVKGPALAVAPLVRSGELHSPAERHRASSLLAAPVSHDEILLQYSSWPCACHERFVTLAWRASRRWPRAASMPCAARPAAIDPGSTTPRAVSSGAGSP